MSLLQHLWRSVLLLECWPYLILINYIVRRSHVGHLTGTSSSKKTHTATAIDLFTVEVAGMWFVEAGAWPSLIIGYGEAPGTIASSTNKFLGGWDLEPSQQISFKETVDKPKPLLLLSFGTAPIRFIRSRRHTAFQKHTPFQTYTISDTTKNLGLYDESKLSCKVQKLS
jgi:hypothetical protein